jgi:signal transduction histidine kinase
MMAAEDRLRVLVFGDETTRDRVDGALVAAGISADVLHGGGDARTDLDQARRELMERELVARREVEAATCSRDEFLATLSHELRTPLNAILGWARLISAGQLDGRTTSRAASIIERNARAEVQLIDDLLDMSRLVNGTVTLNVRPVELRPLLERALDSIRPALQAKNITLEVDISAAPEHLACDGERVQQILWNFLSNALKFTPGGGRISLAAASVGDSVAISVRDTGTGIRPEFLPFVFDRFRQQDAGTTRTQGGLGIGLAIAKHLAELHGGGVQASSEGEERGATFVVTLPQIPADANAVSR